MASACWGTATLALKGNAKPQPLRLADAREFPVKLAKGTLIVDWTGVVVGLLQLQAAELVLVPGLVVLASAVGYLPAMAAYRTDVARSLITTP